MGYLSLAANVFRTTMRQDMVEIVPLDEAILWVNDLIAKIDKAR